MLSQAGVASVGGIARKPRLGISGAEASSSGARKKSEAGATMPLTHKDMAVSRTPLIKCLNMIILGRRGGGVKVSTTACILIKIAISLQRDSCPTKDYNYRTVIPYTGGS